MKLSNIKKAIKDNKLFVSLLVFLTIIILLSFPFIYININYEVYQSSKGENYTGLILGASVVNNYPSDVLKQRLDAGGLAYKSGKVNKLILSGSNQENNYNEPMVMQNYLQDVYSIKSSDLVLDYAGLRTLDSCYRARNVFKAKNITIITQRFHLTRALFLCQQFGFENIDTIPANNSRRAVTFNGYVREIPASLRAFLDIFTGVTSTFEGDGSEQVIEN